jgi:hypothetical protein
MCTHGGRCSTFAPGHALHLIQARLASATPAEWADALVEAVDPAAGDILLRTLDEGAAIRIWNGAGAAERLAPGSPVSLHTRYDVLAIGRERFNCLRG